MNTLVILSCLLVAVAFAAPYGPKGEAYTYHGRYPGKCKYDGIYYRDETSFVYCTNGISYMQQCAPGSKNSAYNKFSYGDFYRTRDFCDINLVDSGYAPPKYEEPETPKYEEPKYEEPKYEEPKYEEPKYEPPKYEPPKYEPPKYEEPKYEPSYTPTYEPKYEEPKYEEPKYEEPDFDYYTYQGMYPGKCAKDGLYYRDEFTFVYCSNGNSYQQPCAPGSKNSAYEKFSYGDKYSYRDFCDINLVDGGYASHDGYGYEYTKASYKPDKEIKYSEPEPPKYENDYAAPPKYEEPKYYAPAPKYEEPKSYSPPKKEPTYEEPKYVEPAKPRVYLYHGKFPGKCQYDGLYYKDTEAFVFCVDGLSYVQKCAPGSRSSPFEKFSYGVSYSERDFCDINLVDSGYVAHATAAAHAAAAKYH